MPYLRKDVKIKNLIKKYKGITGVYSIRIGETTYIGSSVDVGHRLALHFSLLYNNKHINNKLQLSFNNYKISDIEISLLDVCHKNELLRLEFIHKKNELNNCSLECPIRNVPQLRNWSRFDSNIKKTESCWLWIGSKSNKYGRFSINGKRYLAHRLQYYRCNTKDLHNNKILIRHLCNNKSCVNPEHLLSGSYQDNSLDNCKIKEIAQYIQPIRNLSLQFPNLTYRKIAKIINQKLNLSLKRSTLYPILSNKTWNDTNYLPYNFAHLSGEDVATKFSKDIIMQIRCWWNNTKMKLQDIVNKLYDIYKIQTDFRYVHKIISNQVWFDLTYMKRR